MNGTTLISCLLLATWTCAACSPVSGERITGADLARASDAFRAIPGDADLGLSPVAGAKRVFQTAELEAIAARYQVAASEIGEVCFEIPQRPLDPMAVREAARTAVVEALQRGCSRRFAPDGSQARNECRSEETLDVIVMDYARIPVPDGKLRFRPRWLSELSVRPEKGAVLRGAVDYGSHHSVAVWVRVQATVLRSVSFLRRPAKVGETLRAADIEIRQVRESPFLQNGIQPEDIGAGVMARRTLNAGSRLTANLVAPLPAVSRGDAVAVTVQSGGAHLQLEAEAANSAGIGERVLLINPFNGNRFTAKVTASRQAVIQEGGKNHD